MFFNGYIASTDLIAIAPVVIFGLLGLVRRQRVWAGRGDDRAGDLGCDPVHPPVLMPRLVTT